MDTIIRTFFIVLLIMNFVFSVGCEENSTSKIKEKSPWKNMTYDNFVKNEVLPYDAPEKKKQQLITNYNKLHAGMTREEVAVLLGDPDWEDTVHSKLNKPGFMGWCWLYWVYKLEKIGQNLKHDKQIEIFFDIEGRLEKAHSLNINELSGEIK